MISADENPKNWSTTQKSTPPALSYSRAVSGKRHKPLGRPDRNISFPGARGTKDMPGRAHRSPREKPAKKGAGKKTKTLIHQTNPVQVTRRVVSKDLRQW